MTELHLKLMDETDRSTVSALWHDKKFMCFIIEDAFHPIKIPGETRIPGGRYPLIKKTWGGFYDRYSKEFGHQYVIQIANVPNYKDILFHIGNRATDPKRIKKGDTRGCLLTNDKVAFDHSMNEFIGVDSRVCYRKFFTYMDKLMNEPVFINIDR